MSASTGHQVLRSRKLLLGLLAFAVFGLAVTAGSADTAEPSNRARRISDLEAIAILRQPLPEPHYPGLHRVALLANPITLPQEDVMLSYAVARHVVVDLHVFRASNIIRLETTGIEDTTVNGAPARVRTSVVDARDGPLTIVSYTWSERSLSFALNVFLREGLTREKADAIAASIR